MNTAQKRLRELQAVDKMKESLGIHEVKAVKTLQPVKCVRCRATHKILTAMTPPVPLERCQSCMMLSDKELRNRGRH